MSLIITILCIFTGVSFLIYGFSCMVSNRMRGEFIRFGLSRYRPLVGFLQLIAGLSLIVAYRYPLLGCAASGGLCLMMIFGMYVRIRMRDRLQAMLPAVAYAVLCGYLTLALITAMR